MLNVGWVASSHGVRFGLGRDVSCVVSRYKKERKEGGGRRKGKGEDRKGTMVGVDVDPSGVYYLLLAHLVRTLVHR